MPTNNLIRQLPMAGRANFLPYQIGADGKPHWALPGVLAGAANAVTAPYRAMNPQDYPDFNPEEEAANLALNMLGGGGAFGRAPKNALGMNVWHGSPHKFEPTPLNDLGEFNAAKIGTGEGAQAYGHGHYTGEARGTGEEYSKMNPELDSLYSQRGSLRASKKPVPIELDNAIKKAEETAQGHLYKVDIPDEHIAQMLDWDKPLSEQAPEVRAAVQKLANERGINQNSLDTWRGEQILENFGSARNPELSAQKMRELGIPGVRYLDAGSRGAEGGTSNFVVFPGNEHMMTILERNGQAMSPESQAIARYREIKGPKSVVRMEAALRTAGVPLPKNEPVAYIQGLVDRAHKRN